MAGNVSTTCLDLSGFAGTPSRTRRLLRMGAAPGISIGPARHKKMLAKFAFLNSIDSMLAHKSCFHLRSIRRFIIEVERIMGETLGIFSSDPNTPDGMTEIEMEFDENGRIGALGEDFFLRELKRNGFQDYQIHRNLGVPSVLSDSRPMNIDCDVALSAGNNLVLVDVKLWEADAWYWTVPGTDVALKNFGPHLSGKWRLSQSMAITMERYSSRLPRTNILPMVVFVPTPKTHALPSSVRFLTWPGRINSYLLEEAFPIMRDFLGEVRPTAAPVYQFLVEMLAKKKASLQVRKIGS